MKAAIIGGTGVYSLTSHSEIKEIATPFGKVRLSLQSIPHGKKEIVFLPRHGADHATPPHLINYRSNIWALKEIGVSHIFATNAVGSMDPRFKPGDLILFNDFIDCTKGRAHTFHDGEDGVFHTNMADPYCQELRRIIPIEGAKKSIDFQGEGVYVGTEGPRFETAAEINMYRNWGGHVVGMTGIPEVTLAKELGLCYAGVGIITNWATGMAQGDHRMDEIIAAVDENRANLNELFSHIIAHVDLNQKKCRCRQAPIKV